MCVHWWGTSLLSEEGRRSSDKETRERAHRFTDVVLLRVALVCDGIEGERIQNLSISSLSQDEVSPDSLENCPTCARISEIVG